MAEIKTVTVPLNGKNYLTWKVQCRMALMKESVWDIVSGTEEVLGEEMQMLEENLWLGEIVPLRLLC